MKKILVLLLVLAAVFGIKGSSVAEAKAKVKVVTRTYTGTVLWADPIQNTIVLKGDESDVRFKVLATTKIKRRGKVVMLSRLVQGDRVTISYRVQRNTRIAAAIY